MKFVLVLLISGLSLISLDSFGHEHRQHGAHEHGAGKLGIAFEGAKGTADLDIPAESIIGFEYIAKTAADKKKQADALLKLEKNIADMLVFDSSLACKIAKEKIEVVRKKGENHADLEAVFSVVCAKSPAGTTLVFNFQKQFPRIHDLDVDVIVDNLQKSVEAKKDGTSLLLK